MSAKTIEESKTETAEGHSRFTRRGQLSAKQMAEICKIKGTGPACSYMFTKKELTQFCKKLLEEQRKICAELGPPTKAPRVGYYAAVKNAPEPNF